VLSSEFIKFLEWNVHYANKNLDGIVDVLKAVPQDVYGICELRVDPAAIAKKLSDAVPGRRYLHRVVHGILVRGATEHTSSIMQAGLSA
jgi:hypothetical protein